MKLDPKNGIDNLIFGMKTTDVIALYGEPDKEYSDEENNKRSEERRVGKECA